MPLLGGRSAKFGVAVVKGCMLDWWRVDLSRQIYQIWTPGRLGVVITEVSSLRVRPIRWLLHSNVLILFFYKEYFNKAATKTAEKTYSYNTSGNEYTEAGINFYSVTGIKLWQLFTRQIAFSI